MLSIGFLFRERNNGIINKIILKTNVPTICTDFIIKFVLFPIKENRNTENAIISNSPKKYDSQNNITNMKLLNEIDKIIVIIIDLINANDIRIVNVKIILDQKIFRRFVIVVLIIKSY